MNVNVKWAIPAVYAAAVIIGFLINTTAGVIIVIAGAIVSSLLYTMIARATATPATARRPPRQRNRVR
jgi:hypothetical protein